MKKRPNPLEKSGERNLYCPYYEDCLDHAIELHWQNWNCSKCTHRSRQQPLSIMGTVPDLEFCYELPSKIYREVTCRFG